MLIVQNLIDAPTAYFSAVTAVTAVTRLSLRHLSVTAPVTARVLSGYKSLDIKKVCNRQKRVRLHPRLRAKPLPEPLFRLFRLFRGF